MKKAIRNERLKELRRVVEAVPEKLLRMEDVRKEIPCGTAYCAGGWAAQDQYFIEIGLRLTNSKVVPIEFGTEAGVVKPLQECFGLSHQNTMALFGCDLLMYYNYAITKQHVLSNIDRVLADKEALSYKEETNLKILASA